MERKRNPGASLSALLSAAADYTAEGSRFIRTTNLHHQKCIAAVRLRRSHLAESMIVDAHAAGME